MAVVVLFPLSSSCGLMPAVMGGRVVLTGSVSIARFSRLSTALSLLVGGFLLSSPFWSLVVWFWIGNLVSALFCIHFFKRESGTSLSSASLGVNSGFGYIFGVMRRSSVSVLDLHHVFPAYPIESFSDRFASRRASWRLR